MARDQAAKRARRKVLWARAIAHLGGVCVQCGATANLEFDHVDPATKTATLHALVRQDSWRKMEAELAKCQLLCKPCHIAKGTAEGDFRPKLTHLQKMVVRMLYLRGHRVFGASALGRAYGTQAKCIP